MPLNSKELEELQRLEEMEELAQLEALEAKSKQPEPFKYKPRMKSFPDDLRNKQYYDATPDWVKAAAAQGVDTDTGLPDAPYGRASFAFDEVQKAELFKQFLDNKYKQDVAVRMGDTSPSGKLEFFNPDTNRWTVIQPTDAFESIAGAAGGAIPAALSTAGAIAGAVVPGGTGAQVLTGAGGAGLGSAVGEFIRTKVGDWLGVNDEITTGQQVEGAAIEGAKSAAADLAGSAVFQTGRLFRFVMKGKPVFDETTAKSLEANLQMQKALIKEIEAGAGSQFKADASFVPGLASVPAHMRGAIDTARQHMATASNTYEFAQRQAEKQAAMESTLESYFKNKQAAMNPMPAEEAGTAMREAIASQKSAFEDEALTRIGSMQQQGRGIYDSLPASVYDEAANAGRAVREQLQQRYSMASEAETAAWQRYQDNIVYNGETNTSAVSIPLGKAEQAQYKYIKERIKNTLLRPQAAARQSLVPNIDEPAVTAADRALFESLGVALDEKNPSVDLAQLDDMIKWLRMKKRQSLKDSVAPDFSDADLLQMEKFAVNLRNKYLEDNMPHVYSDLLEAEAASRVKSDVFGRGILADALATSSGGRYTMNDADVLYNVIRSNDVSASREFGEILKGSPNAMRQAQNMIYAMYREAAFKDGIPSAARHKAFMKRYGDAIAPFFPEAEKKRMDSYLYFAEQLANEELKYRRKKKLWKEDILGSFDTLSAEKLVGTVFTNSNKHSLDQIKKLYSKLNYIDPDVVAKWKSGVANEISMKIMTRDGLDLAALDRVLKNTPKIRAVMGDGYANALHNLASGLQGLAARAGVSLPPRQGSIQYGLRIIEGPMTRGGRMMTFTGNERAKAFHKQIWKALNDPKELHRLSVFTQLQRMKQGSAQVGAVLLSEDSYDATE